jgi:hypothetical protein
MPSHISRFFMNRFTDTDGTIRINQLQTWKIWGRLRLVLLRCELHHSAICFILLWIFYSSVEMKYILTQKVCSPSMYYLLAYLFHKNLFTYIKIVTFLSNDLLPCLIEGYTQHQSAGLVLSANSDATYAVYSAYSVYLIFSTTGNA